MHNLCLRFTAAFGILSLLTVSVVADDRWQVLFNGKDLEGW